MHRLALTGRIPVRIPIRRIARIGVDILQPVSTIANMSDKTLGQHLKKLRLAKGFSLRDLGGKVRVTAPHLSDIEQGNRQPSEELLARLAEALEADIEDILRYSKRPPAKQMEELIKKDREYGFAFRKFVDAVREKGISPEKIHDITKKLPPKKP